MRSRSATYLPGAAPYSCPMERVPSSICDAIEVVSRDESARQQLPTAGRGPQIPEEVASCESGGMRCDGDLYRAVLCLHHAATRRLAAVFEDRAPCSEYPALVCTDPRKADPPMRQLAGSAQNPGRGTTPIASCGPWRRPEFDLPGEAPYARHATASSVPRFSPRIARSAYRAHREQWRTTCPGIPHLQRRSP